MGPDPLADDVCVFHAEGTEDVLAEVAVEGFPTDVLDDLAEGGEPMVGVGKAGARFDLDAQPTPVVLGEGRDGSRLHLRAQRRPQQVSETSQLTDS